MVESLKSNNYSKNFRLKYKNEFKVFFDSAKSKTLGSVKLYYVKSLIKKQPRLAISVSSKYFNAVQRNSLKRFIREFFRTSKDLFFMMDVVVSVRYSSNLSLSWRSFLNKVKTDLMHILASINIK